MKLSIDTEVVRRNGFTLGDFLICLAVKTCKKRDILTHIDELKERGVLFKNIDSMHLLFHKADSAIRKILLDSEENDMSDEELKVLVTKMREIFPAGKKPGTNIPWRDSVNVLVLRLKAYFKLFGHKTSEEILQATKEYVESFNGIYTNMRVMKYFILKTDNDGCKISDLDSCIANLGNNSQYTFDNADIM